MTVHLVRHAHHAEVGRVLSGRSEIALDATGEAQAAALGRWLADRPIARIHSGPRLRARQTAAHVAAHHALAVEIVPALDEIDFGEWTGMAFAALDGNPRWSAWNGERHRARAPGGETMAEAVARAVGHLESVADAGEVVCVSHCDVIRGVVAHVLGLGFDRLLTFDVDPASVTTLVLDDGGDARLVSLNGRAR